MRPVLSIAFLALAAPALGDGPRPAEEPPPAPSPPPEPSPSPSLDFDLLPPVAPETSPRRDRALERAVKQRRRTLRLHQGLGLATWTALAATTIVGQLDFDDRFRGGGDTGKWHGAHRTLALSTSVLFAGTGLLALVAPEPYEKKTRFDTATVHKASMAIAAAGMAAQIVLGISARGRAGSLRERDLASAHQILGYATFGAMTAGAVVLLF